MRLSLLNPVILAEDYEGLIEWYKKALDMSVKSKTEKGEDYTELECSGELVLGIARADEMGVNPSTPRSNTVVVQLSVGNLDELLDRIRNMGGRVLFGPSLDEKDGYLYGGFADIEGNQIWVVEQKAPD